MPLVSIVLAKLFHSPAASRLASGWVSGLGLTPAGDGALSLDTVRASFDRFRQTDDVFQPSFTNDGFLLVTQPSAVIKWVPANLVKYLESRSLTLRFFDGRAVPESPYFVVGRQLRQAWRLYPDHLRAFSNPVIPDDTVPAPR